MNDVIDLELDLSMLHPVYEMKIHDSFYISNDWENTAGCWNSSEFIKYFNAVQKFYYKMQMSQIRNSNSTNQINAKWVTRKGKAQKPIPNAAKGLKMKRNCRIALKRILIRHVRHQS